MKKTPQSIPQHTVMMKDGIQQQIYETLMNNPGLHSRELCRQLELPYSTIQYHISCLKKQGILQTEQQGKYLYHFIR